MITEENTNASVRQHIAAANERFAAAVSAGDRVTLAQIFTEDTLLLPPHRESISGREQVVDFWAAIASKRAATMTSTFTTRELNVWNDHACEIGEARILAVTDAGEKLLDIGKYLVIWKNVAGTWKMHRDIFNSDLALK